MKRLIEIAIVWLAVVVGSVPAEEPAGRPFPVDWSSSPDSPAGGSFSLDAPAGKDGFIRVEEGHVVRASGGRFRIWGVNITAQATIPTKEAAPRLAAHLARSARSCKRRRRTKAGNCRSATRPRPGTWSPWRGEQTAPSSHRSLEA